MIISYWHCQLCDSKHLAGKSYPEISTPTRSPSVDDMSTLKAWCHWKRKQHERGPLPESDLDFLKAIEDVISQVGTYKTRYEEASAEIKMLKQKLWGFEHV